MMNAYDKSYLYDAMLNLADSFDYAVNEMKIKPDDFTDMFVVSGLSQRELAEKAEVNIRNIQQYEQRAKDISKARVDIVLRLSKALGCKVEDLV